MFQEDLQIGHRNEEIIASVFDQLQVPYIRTYGKNNFDAHLFSEVGPSVECKLDLYSLKSQYMAIEEPTMRRNPDYLIQTLCYTKVFSRSQYEALYMRGKITEMGTQKYDGRLIPKTELKNIPFLDSFIRQSIILK